MYIILFFSKVILFYPTFNYAWLFLKYNFNPFQFFFSVDYSIKEWFYLLSKNSLKETHKE